jgi:hypothetical protein
MLKKVASFVLAALGASRYRKKYASAPRLLRPRWTAFLNILPGLVEHRILKELLANRPKKTLLEYH